MAGLLQPARQYMLAAIQTDNRIVIECNIGTDRIREIFPGFIMPVQCEFISPILNGSGIGQYITALTCWIITAQCGGNLSHKSRN